MSHFETEPDNYYFRFGIKVGVNISPEDLFALVSLVGTEADRVEKLYGSGLDEY
jgi:hypothetical protein